MKSSKFIQSPYLEMKLMTNDEFQEYKNHSCEEYVRQGKTFNYNKMALLNQRYLEPKSEEELETSALQSPEQENTAGDLTDPAPQNADIAISQQVDNVDMADSNSDDVQSVQRSINADDDDDAEASINTSNIQEAESNQNDSQQEPNLSMTQPLADPVPAKNVIQGPKNFKRQVENPKMKPYICSHCNKGYTTNYSMKRHISQVHNNDWKSPQKKDVKRLQNVKKKSVFVKNAVPKSAKAKSVFVPVPVPTPVPVHVKYPKPIATMKDLLNRKPAVKNPRKRNRINLEESDDERENLEPPAKSYITSRRATRRSKNNDDEDGYKSL